jgi:hypothetical protein
MHAHATLSQRRRRAASETARSQPASGSPPWSRPVLQAKLTVSDPGDRYEREADRVADQVMRMPASSPCACGGSCPRCAAGTAMRSAAPSHSASAPAPASADLPAVVARGRSGGGQALDAATRAFMEPRFGRAFDCVRVHADGAAAESARAIGAEAYTVGNDIVFGAGRYTPHSDDGQRLLAHELTHVVQQGAAPFETIDRSAIPRIQASADGVVQRAEITCENRRKCTTPRGDWCIAPDGSRGFCARGIGGCRCMPRERTALPGPLQKVFDRIVDALGEAGVVITVIAIAVIVACLLSPCSFPVLVAAVGFAGALIVISIIKEEGASAGPTARAAGDAAGESLPT